MGEIISVEKSILPMQYDDQSVLAIQLKRTDSEKTNNLALESTLALLKATLESTADGILVTDLNNGIINFNRRFAEFWSLSEQLLLQGDDAAVYRTMLRRFRRRQTGREFIVSARDAREQETFMLLELKQQRWLECRSRPQIVGEQIQGRVYTFADISARMLAEEQLQEAMKRADAANKAKTDFLNHMSHELRTPLNAILGFAQLMQEEGCSPHEEKVDLMLKGAWHLLGLINEVLDLARVESGHIDLQPTTVHVLGIIKECSAFVRPMAEARHIQLDDFCDSISVQVLADPRRLRQMLLNLLSNAIKYNRPQGKVWLSVHVEENTVHIDVHDSGMGISNSDQERLFQNFNRVGQTQNIEGTGIGLAFSRKLAQLMQGNITVTSQLGEGSCFRLSLPQALTANDATNAERATPTTAPGVLHILYVDDDATNRLIVKSSLKKQQNTRIETAESGTEALQRLPMATFDLLIVDMNLEDMTGIDLLKQLPSADLPGAPVRFMLSASDNPEVRAQAKAVGVRRYLTKPLNIKEFIEAIEEIRHHPH